MSNYTLDITLIVIFTLVQWRITRLLLAATSRRWVRAALFLVAVVFPCDLSRLVRFGGFLRLQAREFVLQADDVLVQLAGGHA